jgi:hypothetical protein
MSIRDYIEHQVMWDRIGYFIVIKLFLPEGIERIQKSLVTHKKADKMTYAHAIVTECLVERDKLFTLINTLGVTHKIAPPKVIYELYDICCKYNSGLLM